MNYQIRRIDPYWFAHPAVLIAAIAGAMMAYFGVLTAAGNQAGTMSRLLLIAGAVVCGISILAATKPTVSATMGILALLGYAYSIFFMPDVQMAGQSFVQKLFATLVAASVYMILMDAMVLAAAFLYNFFSVLWGGIRLGIEQAPGGE